MDSLELVNRFLKLLETFDYDGILAAATPAATVWHNDGQGEQSITQSTEFLKQLSGEVQSMRYQITRQFARNDEVLQQHVLHIVFKNGQATEVPTAVYYRFANGLLDRMEEYADHAPPSRPEASDTPSEG